MEKTEWKGNNDMFCTRADEEDRNKFVI